ncbi:MAG: cold shock domain-containing protein [Prevotellaceae bacterium]|jgi:cold shock CspA family protein|nr:cold shock domain-containing protein [Prevotellaceae bacterium]
MAISSNKREVQKKKEQKRKDKQKRKEERKANSSGSLDDMIAYVDENGVITDTPPDPVKRQEVEIESIAVSTPKKENVAEVTLTGRVEFFNSSKGYGFIKSTADTNQYFFHISNAPANIAEGNMVTFELERGERGLNAVRILRLP